MPQRAHRRPTKRAAPSPLEGLFASLPGWAAAPVVIAGAAVVLGVAHWLHYSTQVTGGLVLAVVALMTLAAAAAAHERRLAQTRLVSVRHLDDLRALAPNAFEALVLSAYQARGWRGFLTQRGADGGVDVVLERAGERVYVQCKRWRDRVIRVDAIRSLKGVMAGDGVSHGIFVSSGTYTDEALRVAASYSITTVDGNELLDLIRNARGEVPGLSDDLRASGPADPPEVPSCPRCHADMVERTGARGRFWGCPHYPKCRGTRDL